MNNFITVCNVGTPIPLRTESGFCKINWWICRWAERRVGDRSGKWFRIQYLMSICHRPLLPDAVFSIVDMKSLGTYTFLCGVNLQEVPEVKASTHSCVEVLYIDIGINHGNIHTLCFWRRFFRYIIAVTVHAPQYLIRDSWLSFVPKLFTVVTVTVK